MAPEPAHLTGIVKYCPKCGSQDVKYMYDNNGKTYQPRYKCRVKSCRKFFTFGGKCRGSYGKKRPGVPVKPAFSSPVGVTNGCRSRIAKPNPVRVSSGLVSSLRIVLESEPCDLDGEILAEDPVGGCGSAAIAALGSNLSTGRNSKSDFLDELQESPEGSAVGAAGSPVGARIIDQLQTDKAVQDGAEVDVKWMKAILGIPPFDVVPLPSKQLKRIRVKHQERESVLSYLA